jgi:hypothetical protein
VDGVGGELGYGSAMIEEMSCESRSCVGCCKTRFMPDT